MERGVPYALVVLVALTVNFALPRLMPGSPLRYLAGEEPAALTAEERARLLHRHGLDQPLAVQYLRYVTRTARGDLGDSFQHGRPVLALLAERVPWTLLLSGTALALATTIGVALGLLAAWHRGRPLDWTAIGIAVGLESIPGFWLAMILVAVGGVQLGWFPTFGARDVFTELSGHAYLLDVARHLVLPAMALTLVTLPATVLTTRATLVGELGADYVRAARARGLPESRVLWRHAAANARLPVAAAFFVNLGQVIAGATVVETVFSYPGVGRLLYEAVLARDYAVLEGGFLLVTVSVVLANVVMDLLAPALDPRARPAGGS